MNTKKILSRSNLLYMLYVFILLVIGLEVFGRIYLSYVLKKSSKSKFIFDSYRIYKHKPGFTEGDKSGNWIVINNQGFRRSADVSKVKPANTYRIFLMGGSAGHGISSAPPYPIVHIYMNETIDAYLENMLKAKYPGKNFEVINAAVTGYQCFQHTAYLLSEIVDYHPDMVFFFDGINDHFFNNPEYEYYHQNKYQFWKSRLEDPAFSGIFDYTMLWLSNYSGFARGYYAWKLTHDAGINERTFLVNVPLTTVEDAIIKQKIIAKKGFLRAIETNIQILKANNIACIVTLQPMLALRNKDVQSGIEKPFADNGMYIKPLYKTVVDELNELTYKYSVPMYDFNPAFNETRYKNQQLFIDYCHLTPRGGKAVAENILPLVDSLYNLSISKAENAASVK